MVIFFQNVDVSYMISVFVILQAVLALDVSPDGKTVVCGTQDGVVRMFDVATGNVRYYMFCSF